jgi:hypothetical protein
MNAKGIREALAAGKITGRFYCPKIHLLCRLPISYKTAEDAEDEAAAYASHFSKAIGSGCNIMPSRMRRMGDRAVATAPSQAWAVCEKNTAEVH